MPSFVAGLVNYIQFSTTVSFQGVHPPPLFSTEQMPIALVSMIDGSELENMEGLSELTDTIMQVAVVSNLYDTAFFLRSQLVAFLINATGPVSGLSGISIDRATDFRYRDLYLPDTELWHMILRCHIWWRPS